MGSTWAAATSRWSLSCRTAPSWPGAADPPPRRDNHPTIDAKQLLGVVEDILIDLVGEDWVIAAVCVAGVGEDGVPVAADGHAIKEALAWFDPRRTDAYDQLPAAVRMAAVWPRGLQPGTPGPAPGCRTW